jgi:1-aminocyclopropane-1-carboxylate deaminase/D-cysteine desulfhydrase-like pyridoxal-dependent ACC family enzyme
MEALADAGRELVAQVRAGLLPEPDWVVVPLGSGGTCVGLAAGLHGLKTKVLAVATVEWVFSPGLRLRALQRELGQPAVPLA